MESRVGSLVGASGSYYGFRKILAEEWYPDMSSDFYIPIIACIKGFRTVLDQSAEGHYSVLGDPDMEFKRKVRTIVHGIDVLFHFKKVLNPFKYGLFSIQILSHKLMRWLVPFAMILAFLSNIAIAIYSPFYKTLLYCQVFFYSLAVVSHFIKGFQGNAIFKIPYFFVMANHSILAAWIEYAEGERHITWQSTKR